MAERAPILLLIRLGGHVELHSTRLTEDAEKLRERFRREAQGYVRVSGGQVRRALGDDVLGVFTSLSEAMDCAIKLREGLGGGVLAQAGASLKIALHDGEQEQLVRLSGLGGRNEIVLGAACIIAGAPHLPIGWKVVPMYRNAADREIGPSAALACRLLPPADSAPAAARTAMASMRVRYHDREWLMGPAYTRINLGRESINDMVVRHGKASRRHGRLEYRAGAFVYVDSSSNGSFWWQEGGGESLLRAEEVVLTGRGKVFLGLSGNDPRADFFEYDILSDPRN